MEPEPAGRVPALARRPRCARPATSPLTDQRRPSFRHRLEYAAVVDGGGGRAPAADARRCSPPGRCSGARSTPSTARIGGWRCATCEAAFPVRTAAECRAIARRHVRALRPAADGAAEVQHDVAGADAARASSSRARSACARAHAHAARRAALHRPLRLLGDQRAGARARRSSRWRCWRVRSTTRCCTICSRAVRRSTGNSVIYRRGAIRRVLRALEANQAVAVLIDQHIQTADAVYVDFFNRPAATTSALAALALRTGAPVVPVFALPLPGGRFRMVYEHAVEPPPPTIPTRSASSRSAAPTCSRCTCAAIPSSGCGCTAAGATSSRRASTCAACSRPRAGKSSAGDGRVHATGRQRTASCRRPGAELARRRGDGAAGDGRRCDAHTPRRP